MHVNEYFETTPSKISGTSFWFEMWTPLGCLHDVLEGRGHIVMGIPEDATVEACRNHRKRKHRVQLLNKVELEIEKYKNDWKQEEDVSLWKNEKGRYKKAFSTKYTWLSIREKHQPCDWHQVVWFKHATPRYSFILWTAIHERLSTGDRVRGWNINADVSCGFCQDPLETKKHLFFECLYSMEVWEGLMRRMMGDQYTHEWEKLIRLLARETNGSKVWYFIVRHVFQSTVHAIWRERNRRKHGEKSVPSMVLIKRIDKEIRNKFTIIRRKGDSDYEEGMQMWFNTR